VLSLLLYNAAIVTLAVAPILLTTFASKAFEVPRKLPYVGAVLSCWWCTAHWLTLAAVPLVMGTTPFSSRPSVTEYLQVTLASLVLTSLLFPIMYYGFLSVKFGLHERVAGVTKAKP
jgi:hypothetical protein